jgi:hypothetical protein
MSGVFRSEATKMPALEYPVFDEPFGRSLDACAQLKTKNNAVLQQLAKATKKGIRARVGKGIHAEYISVLGGGGQKASKRHLHISVASAAYFESPPTNNESVSRLASTILPFFGQKVMVTVTARFSAHIGMLPEKGIVRSSLVESVISGVPVRQIVAAFVFGEAEKETEILIMKNKEMAQIELEFRLETTIDRNYLRRLHEQAFTTFVDLVLGGTKADEPIAAA